MAHIRGARECCFEPPQPQPHTEETKQASDVPQQQSTEESTLSKSLMDVDINVDEPDDEPTRSGGAMQQEYGDGSKQTDESKLDAVSQEVDVCVDDPAFLCDAPSGPSEPLPCPFPVVTEETVLQSSSPIGAHAEAQACVRMLLWPCTGELPGNVRHPMLEIPPKTRTIMFRTLDDHVAVVRATALLQTKEAFYNAQLFMEQHYGQCGRGAALMQLCRVALDIEPLLPNADNYRHMECALSKQSDLNELVALRFTFAPDCDEPCVRNLLGQRRQESGEDNQVGVIVDRRFAPLFLALHNMRSHVLNTQARALDWAESHRDLLVTMMRELLHREPGTDDDADKAHEATAERWTKRLVEAVTEDYTRNPLQSTDWFNQSRALVQLFLPERVEDK